MTKTPTMHHRIFNRLLFVFTVATLAIVPAITQAAFIYVGGTYQQNFNSLSNTGTTAAWTDDGTLTGWYAGETTYRIDDGASTASGLYSYGTSGSSDRALGSLTTNGNPTRQISLQILNGTGSVINQFTLGYTGEQWRGSGQGRQNFLAFDYRFDAVSGINAAAGTSVSGLTFGSLQTSNPLDGNLAANRTSLSQTVTGLTWDPGEYLTLRWTDTKLAGNNHGLGIDDLTFTTNFVAVPEPAYLFALVAYPVYRRMRQRRNP